MSNTEPRIARAQKKLKAIPAWVQTYESYEPAEQPWPPLVLPLLLLGQGIVWAEGGHPNIAALCQIMSQTDRGISFDVTDNDTAWEMLVGSLSGLAWEDEESKVLAFQAAACILADSLRKVEMTQQIVGQSEVTANDVIADVYGQVGEPADPSEGDGEPMFMDTDEITEEDLEELRQELSTGQEEG
jgi:hypothetical protein